MGIPHPWTRDGNSMGMGVGQPKMPLRTPVPITKDSDALVFGACCILKR